MSQMPFADDVRRYTFPSLDRLINKKGELVTSHPYIPTDEQMAAMEKFVDSMDLANAAEVNDEGFATPSLRCVLYYSVVLIAKRNHGLTRDGRTTPRFIERSKRNSMRLW